MTQKGRGTIVNMPQSMVKREGWSANSRTPWDVIVTELAHMSGTSTRFSIQMTMKQEYLQVKTWTRSRSLTERLALSKISGMVQLMAKSYFFQCVKQFLMKWIMNS